MRDTKIDATIQSACKSQPAWLTAAAPLKVPLAWTEGTPARGQVADSICTTCSKGVLQESALPLVPGGH